MFVNRRCLSATLASLLLGICAFLFSPLIAHAGYLYLLNDDSTGNRIYGYRVDESTGGLTALSGFPVSAGLGGINSVVSERMVVDSLNRRLYVVNEGSDSISAYSINVGTGALTPTPFSPIALGTGVWNTIAVHPSGSLLMVADNATNGQVHSFRISQFSATPATGSPFTVTGAAGFSSEFTRNGLYYYVGGNIGNAVAGFSVNTGTGVMTPLSGSPFVTGTAAGPLAYATDKDGRFFTVNSANEVLVFTGAALTPVTGNPFASGLSQRRFGIMSPNDNFYIVAGNTGNNVAVYRIQGTGAATTAAAVTGSPFATGGTTANTLAINRSGKFLFVGNRISRNVTSFSMDPATGQLVSLGVQAANTLGTVGAINGIGYLAPPSARADFDGDGATDQSVFRPSEGNWYLNRSTAGSAVQNWGVSGDELTPGDFDGDDKTDIAIFRPSTGTWWILRSHDGTVVTSNFGLSGDVPVAGDYDGDFNADIAVFRPSTNVWYIQNSGGGTRITAFGASGDLPVREDYDGDGKTDIAIYRPSTGRWWILDGGLFSQVAFGLSTDKPVPADYDGDHIADIAVFRPSNGRWYIRESSTSFVFQWPFGISTDIPVPGDYDGDGRDDHAVYRNGTWWMNRSASGVLAVAFGASTDTPVPSKYIP